MSPDAERHGLRRASAVLATALLGASLATGVAHAESGGTRVDTGYDTATSSGSYGPGLGAPITRAAIIQRAEDWVNDAVQYSETSGWQDANVGGPYRSDCSGMVSMAWALPTSLVTQTLPDDANAEAISSLQEGDILDDTAEHTVIFDQWVDESTETFDYYYEGSTGEPAMYAQGTLDATDFDGHPSSDYGAYEYDDIVSAPPVNEFNQDIRYSTGSWQGWAPLHGANGAADFQGPALAATGMPDGSSQVLGVGLTGLVYHNIRTASGPWDGWTALAGVGSAANFAVDTTYASGSVAITDLPVASTSGVYGTSEMLAIGDNDEVYYNSLNGAGVWSGFAEVPGLNGASGFSATKVGIAGEPDGSSVLTAYNTTNGDMYDMIRSAAGVWGAWTAVPGYNTSANFSGPDLSVAASPSGTVQFLAVGVDDLVYYNTLDPSTGVFSGWLKVAGYNGTADFQVIKAYDTSSIGIAAMPDGSVQMTAIGLTDLIYHNILSSTGTWQGWDGLQGMTSGAFAAASVTITGMPDGSSQIFATTSN